MRLFSILNGICQYLAARNKTLWTGVWSSGSITVPDSTKYISFIVTLNGKQCFCSKGARGEIFGSMSFKSTTGELFYEDVFRCSIVDDVWNLTNLGELGHEFSSVHSRYIAAPAISITSIIGLDPILSAFVTIGGWVLPSTERMVAE